MYAATSSLRSTPAHCWSNEERACLQYLKTRSIQPWLSAASTLQLHVYRDSLATLGLLKRLIKDLSG